MEAGVAGLGFDFSHDGGECFDEEAATVVDDVLADDTAVDDLGAFLDDEVSLDVSKNVDAASVFDDEVAVDGAADVELAAFNDGDVATDRAPELDGFVDDGAAWQATTFLAHGGKL